MPTFYQPAPTPSFTGTGNYPTFGYTNPTAYVNPSNYLSSGYYNPTAYLQPGLSPYFGFPAGVPLMQNPSLVPVGMAPYNPSGTITSSLLVPQDKPPTSNITWQVTADDSTKVSKQYAPYSPDYDDPYGVKTYSDNAKGFMRLEKKEFGDIVGATPYDNEDLLRKNLPIGEQSIRTNIITSDSGIEKVEYKEYGLYSYKSQEVSEGRNMYSLNDAMKRQKDNYGKSNKRSNSATRSLQPTILAKTKQLIQTECDDENIITLNIATDIKGQKINLRLQIHKAYRVNDVKEETLLKLKGIVKPDKANCTRLLKGTDLLKEDATLEDAKLVNNDLLHLIIDKNLLETVKEEQLEAKQFARRLDELADEDLIPKLSKAGYKTIPEFRRICRMSETELKQVSDFTVENEWGKIIFEGTTDVIGIDLDDTIEILHEEIIVYPDDKKKPVIGKKLNKAATIHLYKCFPKKTTNSEKFKAKLKAASSKQDAEFIRYDDQTGEWVFKVKHFTKYGLGEESEEESVVEEVVNAEEIKKSSDLHDKIDFDRAETKLIKDIGSESEDSKVEEHKKVKRDFFEESSSELRNELSSEEVKDTKIEGKEGVAVIQKRDETKETNLKNERDIFSHNLSDLRERTTAFPEIREEIKELPKESSSRMFVNLPSESSQSSDVHPTGEQATKRRIFNLGESPQPLINAFSFDTEPVELEIHLPKENFKTKYICAPVDYSLINKHEKRIKVSEFPGMGQSFRVGWRRDGVFSRVGSVSEKKGTFECSLYKLQIHKSLHNEETKHLEKYKEVTYNSLMKMICDLCVKKAELLYKDLKKEDIMSDKGFITYSLQLQDIPLLWKDFVQHLIEAKYEGNGRIYEKLQTEAEIWILINDLFGNPQIDLSSYIKDKRFSKYNIMNNDRELTKLEINVLRKNLVSNWLKIHNEDSKESINKGNTRKDTLRKITIALSQNNLKEALDLATTIGICKPFFGLASLFCSSTERVKELILKQFSEWDGSNINKSVNPDIKEIYGMLIHCRRYRKSYDWKRQLGMCLWYDCPQEKSIREVFYALGIIEDDLNPKALFSKYSEESKESIKDLCYNLIGAYANISQYPLEIILDSKGYTSDHMEHKLVWMIFYMLRILLKSKGNQCTLDLLEIKTQWKDNKVFAMRLTNKMIEELEYHGYWYWSILVYLLSKDIYGPKVISEQIEILISRNIKDLNSLPQIQSLLIDTLKVPSSIVNRCKGIYFMSMRRWSNAIRYLEEAGEWSLTHKLLWENVVPGLISNKGRIPVVAMTTIKNLLLSLDKHKREIPDWERHGKLLKSYLEILLRRKLEVKNETFYVDIIEKIKGLLRVIDCEENTFSDRQVMNKMMNKLRKIAGKIQSEYYEYAQKIKKEKNIDKFVPIPLETKESIGVAIDERLLEDGILRMICRASKCQ